MRLASRLSSRRTVRREDSTYRYGQTSAPKPPACLSYHGGMVAAEGEPKRLGRRRDPSKDIAVLDATVKLLATEGLDGMTMDQVAAATGISKMTMYKRWSSKTALIGAALNHLQVDHVLERTGSTREDLIALLIAMARQYDEVGGMSILGSCLTDEPRSGELLKIIRESTLVPRRAHFKEVLQSGLDRGVLRADTDLEAAVSSIVGAFYADHLAGIAFTEDRAATIVNLILAGLRA